MKKISVDHMVFEGYEKVLEAIDPNPSPLRRVIDFLNMEVEIPITAMVLSCIFLFSSCNLEKKSADFDYRIVVIEAGGDYEIY